MQDGAGSGKEIVNLPIDAELIATAKERGVDLAELLERALRRELPTTEGLNAAEQAWRREQAAVFAAWNEEVEREGLWNEEFRPFRVASSTSARCGAPRARLLSLSCCNITCSVT